MGLLTLKTVTCTSLDFSEEKGTADHSLARSHRRQTASAGAEAWGAGVAGGLGGAHGGSGKG